MATISGEDKSLTYVAELGTSLVPDKVRIHHYTPNIIKFLKALKL